jgi:hypothetical protein
VIAGTAFVSIATFIVGLSWFGIVGVATRAMTITQDAVVTMRDKTQNDLARERTIQLASLRLLAVFGALVGRIGLAIGLSFAPIWLAHISGLAAADGVLRFLAGWEGALIATAVAAVAWGVRMWPWPTS